MDSRRGYKRGHRRFQASFGAMRQLLLAQNHVAIDQFCQKVSATFAGPQFEVSLIPVAGDLDDQTAGRVPNLDTANDAKMTAVQSVGNAQNRGKSADNPPFSRAQTLQLDRIQVRRLFAMT